MPLYAPPLIAAIALLGILRCNPLAITAASDFLDPRIVLQVPLNGFADSALKGFARLPSEFAFDLRCVHGVAAIVPRAVGDEGDQLFVGKYGIAGLEFVEN